MPYSEHMYDIVLVILYAQLEIRSILCFVTVLMIMHGYEVLSLLLAKIGEVLHI